MFIDPNKCYLIDPGKNIVEEIPKESFEKLVTAGLIAQDDEGKWKLTKKGRKFNASNKPN